MKEWQSRNIVWGHVGLLGAICVVVLGGFSIYLFQVVIVCGIVCLLVLAFVGPRAETPKPWGHKGTQ
jgi:hypothetical protein